jgi:hypothetical protein
MTDPKPLVRVQSSGMLATSSAAWSHLGNLRATVIAKAQFTFAGGKLFQIPAEAVRRDTEMAFRLARAEVVLSGLSFAGSNEAPARIRVLRGDQILMDLTVPAPPPGGVVLTGRIAPFSPERSAYLHGLSPMALEQPFVELPAAFAPAFFQSAPASQQVASLAGGDTLVLERLFPGHAEVKILLPSMQVSATGHMDDRSLPVGMALDTLDVDADRRRLTMLWRGRLAVTQPDAFQRSYVMVQLAQQGRGHVEADGQPLPPKEGASAYESTVALGPDGSPQADGGSPPGSVDPAGAQPAGAQPAGAQPAGAQPAGAQPAGAQPAGAQPAGAELATTAPVGTDVPPQTSE